VPRTPRELVDDVSRELDLLVFRLERPTSDAGAERAQLRRELERLQGRLHELADRLGD
jgi:hypothetical protein